VRPNVASRGLSREWRLPCSILLHFLEFTFNNNGLVNHVLEINVISVEQLELNMIVQPFQEHVLLLFISVDVFGGVSGQLNELVEVLIDRHAALPQVGEFLLL
jgi:Mg2+/Co2+ transporter CorC